MKYTIKKSVRYRKVPRTFGNKSLGVLESGRIIDVLETHAGTLGQLWGRFSQPDAHNQSLWFCIRTMNNTFATPTPASDDISIPDDFDVVVEIDALKQRVSKLENAK